MNMKNFKKMNMKKQKSKAINKKCNCIVVSFSVVLQIMLLRNSRCHT